MDPLKRALNVQKKDFLGSLEEQEVKIMDKFYFIHFN